MTEEKKAREIARAVEEKKGEGIRILDLRQHTIVTDYFVLATGKNQTQLVAMADHLADEVPGLRHREGGDRSGWILLDYGDVVAHLFLQEVREYYDIERLWGDAQELPLDASQG